MMGCWVQHIQVFGTYERVQHTEYLATHEHLQGGLEFHPPLGMVARPQNLTAVAAAQKELHFKNTSERVKRFPDFDNDLLNTKHTSPPQEKTTLPLC